MTLAWLLLGPGNLRRSRWYLMTLGALLLLVGLAVVLDASDRDASDLVTRLALEAAGWLTVALGLFKLAFTVLASGGATPSVFGFQGVVYIILGFAIADFPTESGTAVPWLFGVACLLNGLYQLLSALIIRYPRWGWFVVSGLAHLCFGILVFLEWKVAIHWVVPLLLGASLSVFGVATLRTALRVDRFAAATAEDDPWSAVRYYLDFHLPRRFRAHELLRPEPMPDLGAAHGDLLVHIWTPITVSRIEQDPNLVSRYVVARDHEGKFTVGHAALEMGPDVYISHCDGDPEAFNDTDEVWRTLRSRDVSGVFLPTFQEEVAHYMDPSVTVRFRTFSAPQLRAFWEAYRAITAYNFTNRNCSVAVALALEAALMGSMAGRSRLKSLLRLLGSRDLWMAHFIRWKAREMVWTPGIMLDYALALQRVVEG